MFEWIDRIVFVQEIEFSCYEAQTLVVSPAQFPTPGSLDPLSPSNFLFPSNIQTNNPSLTMQVVVTMK
jgi:hypothetical protein